MKKASIGLMLSLFMLGGCKIITTSATIYHGDNHLERGTIMTMPAKDSEANSLEYKTIGDYIVTELTKFGYVAATKDQKPEFIAKFQYVMSKPIKRFDWSKGSYFEFNHSIEIEIYKQVTNGKPEKKYELKAAYVGLCGNVNPRVVLRMVDAIFKDFPGQNGQTYKHKLDLNKGELDSILVAC